jgi:hypothetical protein
VALIAGGSNEAGEEPTVRIYGKYIIFSVYSLFG